jgi:hypothetical protein
MDWENSIECEVEAPNDPSETDNDQGAIDKGTEPNFPKLGGDGAFQNITNRVEGWVIRITDEI